MVRHDSSKDLVKAAICPFCKLHAYVDRTLEKKSGVISDGWAGLLCSLKIGEFK